MEGDKDSLTHLNHFAKLLKTVIDGVDDLTKKLFKDSRGRPMIYSTHSIIKAFLVMVCYRLTSVRSLARFLTEQRELAKLCGFKDKTPCYRTLCRRFKSLDNWVLEYCRIFITSLTDSGLIKLNILIIDGTPAKSKCKKPRKRGAKNTKSDTEARFGYQKWGKECYFGYKINILSTAQPLVIPLAWLVIPANLQEVNHLIPTVSQATWLLNKDRSYELVGDSGVDSQTNYNWCQSLNIRLTCPLNQANKPKGERLDREKFYQSKLGQKLYKRRTDIERLNGQLKDLFLIDPLPIRRLKNVQTFVNLTMLAYLAAVYYNHQNSRKPRAIKSLIA